MAGILAEMFAHNTWANLRLLEACRPLRADQLAAEVPGTYGRIDSTLVHLLGAEERYLASLAGVPPRPTPREREPFPGIAELEQLARANGRGLEQVTARTRANRVLRGTYRGQPFTMPVWVPLVQAINHATEHRAHVMTILTQIGITPPEIDGWAYADSRAAV